MDRLVEHLVDRVDATKNDLLSTLHQHVNLTVNIKLDDLKQELTSLVQTGVIECIRLQSQNQQWRVQTTYAPVVSNSPDQVPTPASSRSSSIAANDGESLSDTNTNQCFADVTFPSGHSVSMPLDSESLPSQFQQHESMSMANQTKDQTVPANNLMPMIEQLQIDQQVTSRILIKQECLDESSCIPINQTNDTNDTSSNNVQVQGINEPTGENILAQIGYSNSQVENFPFAQFTIQNQIVNQIKQELDSNNSVILNLSNIQSNQLDTSVVHDQLLNVPKGKDAIEVDLENEFKYETQAHSHQKFETEILPNRNDIKNTRIKRGQRYSSRIANQNQNAVYTFSSDSDDYDYIPKVPSARKRGKKQTRSRIPKNNGLATISKQEDTPQLIQSTAKNTNANVDAKAVKEEDGTGINQVEGILRMVHLDCTEPSCPIKSDSIDTLHQHLKDHHGLNPRLCFASGCKLRFKSRTDLGVHIHSQHLRNTRFVCAFDRQVFATQSSAYYHWYKMHMFGRFECTICSVVKNTRSKMTNHYYSHHRTNSRFNSSQMQYSASNNSVGKNDEIADSSSKPQESYFQAL